MILLLCLSAFLQIGWAQNTMESIRQRYSDIKDYIATHTGDNKNDGAEWGEYYHVVARQFLPGTGGHQEGEDLSLTLPDFRHEPIQFLSKRIL